MGHVFHPSEVFPRREIRDLCPRKHHPLSLSLSLSPAQPPPSIARTPPFPLLQRTRRPSYLSRRREIQFSIRRRRRPMTPAPQNRDLFPALSSSSRLSLSTSSRFSHSHSLPHSLPHSHSHSLFLFPPPSSLQPVKPNSPCASVTRTIQRRRMPRFRSCFRRLQPSFFLCMGGVGRVGPGVGRVGRERRGRNNGSCVGSALLLSSLLLLLLLPLPLLFVLSSLCVGGGGGCGGRVGWVGWVGRGRVRVGRVVHRV